MKQKASCRTLPMPEEIAAILREEKRDRYGEETPPPENYLCLNPEGEPIASNYLSQSFKQFLQEHGLREIRLYQCLFEKRQFSGCSPGTE